MYLGVQGIASLCLYNDNNGMNIKWKFYIDTFSSLLTISSFLCDLSWFWHTFMPLISFRSIWYIAWLLCTTGSTAIGKYIASIQNILHLPERVDKNKYFVLETACKKYIVFISLKQNILFNDWFLNSVFQNPLFRNRYYRLQAILS